MASYRLAKHPQCGLARIGSATTDAFSRSPALTPMSLGDGTVVCKDLATAQSATPHLRRGGGSCGAA